LSAASTRIELMPVPVKAPIIEIRIDLFWRDGYGQGTKSFFSVAELAVFLKGNPEIAKAVNYIVKK
jgi:hypothetical protein